MDICTIKVLVAKKIIFPEYDVDIVGVYGPGLTYSIIQVGNGFMLIVAQRFND